MNKLIDLNHHSTEKTPRQRLQERLSRNVKRRHRREWLFKHLGLGAMLLSLGCVALLFFSIASRGLPAFWQATITLPIYIDENIVAIPPAPSQAKEESSAAFAARQTAWRNGLNQINWQQLLQQSVAAQYPEAELTARDLRTLFANTERYALRDMVAEQPHLIGTTVTATLLADARVDVWVKGNIDRELPDSQQQLSPVVRQIVGKMQADGVLKTAFSTVLFTHADSRNAPAAAGLKGAFLGSLYMLLVVILVAIPIGVGGAIYLEEFAPKNKWTDFIEVNVNNLAAVPSIVFGLLGAALFINFFKLPLSAPIVGGLVLSLMALPTVIITTRAALQAVPASIRQAALGVGASPTQTVFHHVVPLALPGVLTGAILAMAQSLGETAPLLLIGMNAFVANIPASPMDQATALPVQIYLWQGNELRNFFEARTSAAILVLLLLIISANTVAIWLRKRLENRWK